MPEATPRSGVAPAVEGESSTILSGGLYSGLPGDTLDGMGGGADASRARERVWPSFLRGESAAWIQARLSEGDPLRLAERCARRLRERWVLLDPERVRRRAVAVCAEAAAHESAPEELEPWALEKIDRAIGQLLEADAEAERSRPGELNDEEREFDLLTRSLLVEPGLVRTISVAFNLMDALPRRAFFELLIEGKEPGEVIETGPWDHDGLRAAVLSALHTIGYDLDTDKRSTREDR